VNASSTATEIQHLRNLETEVRDFERKEAILWRIRSRVRWLKLGEAPSRYFFATLKATQVRSTIKALRPLSGSIQQEIVDDAGLLAQVYTNFANTFAKDDIVSNNKTEQDPILTSLGTKLIAEDNAKLLSPPTEEEICSTVFSLKNDKAPGMDGVSAKVLKLCWDFLGPDCCKMVYSFWNTGKLPNTMVAAIIKLLPREGTRCCSKTGDQFCCLTFLTN
jgi:hypothetical protein